jgi:hypothetical protein
MAIFNLHDELNSFYELHVRLGKDRRKKLAGYRDACLERLKEGLKKLGDERSTVYKAFIRYIGQGSYPMYTLNQHANDEYDIDVALIFRSEDLPTTALEARKRMADALLATGGNFREDPEARTNAVTVWYADGPHVDLAIYREVPGLFGSTLEHAGADWQARDPEAVTNWFLERVETKSPLLLASVQPNQLRRVVRWTKAFARSRTSWSLPGGMIITALVVETYRPDCDRDDIALYDTIKALINRLKYNLEVDNPVSPGVSLTSKSAIKSQMKLLLEKLEWIQPKLAVLAGSSCTRDQALTAWGKFFNHEFWGSVVEAEGPSEITKSAGVAQIDIAVGVAHAEGARTTPYVGERSLSKGKWLHFRLPPDWAALDKASFRWTVTNTGDEAQAASDMEHVRDGGTDTWRHTRYKGVHTMTCEVIRDGRVIGRGVRRVRVAPW